MRVDGFIFALRGCEWSHVFCPLWQEMHLEKAKSMLLLAWDISLSPEVSMRSSGVSACVYWP
jgi:hypothetical protein